LRHEIPEKGMKSPSIPSTSMLSTALTISGHFSC
jgi:hypothetical protein